MSEWVIRPFEEDDANCLVSMWLRSYSQSREIGAWLSTRGYDPSMPRRWFLRATTSEEREQERYYWAHYWPMVTGLLRHCDTRVLCDPERVHSTPNAPSCIWAWACVSPHLVHYVAVKQDVVKSGRDLATEMVAALLEDKLAEPQRMTFEQRELVKLGLVPENWSAWPEWLDRMRRLSLWARRQPEGMLGATSAVLHAIAEGAVWSPKEAA